MGHTTTRPPTPKRQGGNKTRLTVSQLTRKLFATFIGFPLAMGGLLTIPLLPAAQTTNRVIEATTGTWDDLQINDAVFDTALPGHVTFLDTDNNQIAVFYQEDRVPLNSIDAVSPALIDAVLATEDATFYTGGVLKESGLARALVTGVGGGSGIHQQYAKLLCAQAGSCYGGEADEHAGLSDRGVGEKLVELKYAAEMDKRLSRDEILLGYLNTAYFGNGAYGVGAAARVYFDVAPGDLDLVQSALLAGLLQSPAAYDPLTNEDAALRRRSQVLGRMVDAGMISQGQASEVAGEPLGVSYHPLPNGCASVEAPYFCEWVKGELLSQPYLGATLQERTARFQKGGFTVYTTLNTKAFRAMQDVLDTFWSGENLQAAQAIVDVGTGHVAAVGASTDFAESQWNIPVDGAFQPGSIFKPITYAAALEAGVDPNLTLSGSSPFHPKSGVEPDGGFRNLFGVNYGQMKPADAFKVSANTWFVRLAEQVGVEQIADTAFALGMESMNPNTRTVGPVDLSITLGAVETSVVDMASVYATFAGDGVACKPTPIIKVETDGGEDMGWPTSQCDQAISVGTATHVTQALAATASEGGTAQRADLPGVAWRGKTGTTDNRGALWFAGYTPKLASAVWVGDMRGPTYGTGPVTVGGRWVGTPYGGDVAAPIWAETMRRVTAGTDQGAFTAPQPVVPVRRSLPNVEGLSVDAAYTLLVEAGVDAATIHITGDPTMPVTTQNPPAGSTTWASVELGTGEQR